MVARRPWSPERPNASSPNWPLVQADAPSATPGPAVTAVGAASAMPATDTAPVPGPAAQNPGHHQHRWSHRPPHHRPLSVEQTLPRTTAPGRRPKRSADEAQDLGTGHCGERCGDDSGRVDLRAPRSCEPAGAVGACRQFLSGHPPTGPLSSSFGRCARAIATTERLGQSESAAPYYRPQRKRTSPGHPVATPALHAERLARSRSRTTQRLRSFALASFSPPATTQCSMGRIAVRPRGFWPGTGRPRLGVLASVSFRNLSSFLHALRESRSPAHMRKPPLRNARQTVGYPVQRHGYFSKVE